MKVVSVGIYDALHMEINCGYCECQCIKCYTFCFDFSKGMSHAGVVLSIIHCFTSSTLDYISAIVVPSDFDDCSSKCRVTGPSFH